MMLLELWLYSEGELRMMFLLPGFPSLLIRFLELSCLSNIWQCISGVSAKSFLEDVKDAKSFSDRGLISANTDGFNFSNQFHSGFHGEQIVLTVCSAFLMVA